MRQTAFRDFTRLFALLLAIALLMSACRAKPSGGVRVLLDGQEWSGGPVTPESEDELRVYVTWDGSTLIDLPFGEAHRVLVLQPDGEENEIVLTGDAVFMEHANCENQDCVEMGSVTRDNYELRVMGGFIICLPHRVSVEVRGE